LYTRCTDRFTKILANQSVPTYEYLFEYRGQYSIVNLQGEQVDMGVAHGDDLQYIFSDIWYVKYKKRQIAMEKLKLTKFFSF